jgi:hypothetical protein
MWSYLEEEKLKDLDFDFKSGFKSAKGVKAVASSAVMVHKLNTKHSGNAFTLPA